MTPDQDKENDVAELEWARFYGKIVDVRIDYGNRVVLRTVRGLYISLHIKDVYIRNDGKIFVKRAAKVRREGEEEI